MTQEKGQGAIHMVSARARQHRLGLGPVKVDRNSNRITAIPKLLKGLELNGCIVMIDAMGVQTAIAQQIVAQGADSILALKGHQGNRHESARSC